MQKIFIISSYHNNRQVDLANKLCNEFDFEIGKQFTTDESLKSIDNIYLSISETILAYKNNALLYCVSSNKSEHTIGLTMDEYYNSDIFCMTIEEFLNISESRLSNVLIIWLDCINIDKTLQHNVKIFINTLESLDYLYFNENDNDKILEVIKEYLNADNKIKKQILEENH